MVRSIKRRSFLKSAAIASSALSMPAVHVRAQGKKYKTAVIGAGWWGMNICTYAMLSGECTIVALCDVDQRQLTKADEIVKEYSSDNPKHYMDYREMLKKEKPEIVIVATPDHWHALPTIEAVQSGAHVYVEKPICHTIEEGLAMVQAAREADRKVQIGTHRRVGVHNKSAMEFLKSGKLGKVSNVKAFVIYGGGSGEAVANEPIPEGLDWDMWCGPAPYRPYNPRLHPKGFRQFLDYANGTLGDWGIHWLDQILWWTEEEYPKTVYSTGGRHVKTDMTDAPDTQIATYEFDTFTCYWEHRLCAPMKPGESNVGVNFYGTEGIFYLGWRDGWTFYPRGKGNEIIHEDAVFDNQYTGDSENIKGLWSNLLDCIKNDKMPVCDIEIGYRATLMSLLGMLSLKIGRSVRWDPQKQLAVRWDSQKNDWRLDSEANQQLVRKYRDPWEYPKISRR